MGGFDWGNTKTFNQGGGRDREKLSDVVDVVEYPDNDYGAYRFIANPKGTAVHWVTTLGKPKPGQTKAKLANFPKVCLGLDPETMEVTGENCPYCTLLELSPRIEIRQNVIDRSLQENEPRNAKSPSKTEGKLQSWNGGKWHLKDGKGKGGWTPVRVMSVIPAIGNGIAEITSLNRHTVKGEKKEFGPDHKRFGYDVMVKYDKNEAPAKMYKTQKGEIQPLTEEEMGLLIWNLPDHKPEDLKTATKEAKRMKQYLCNRDGELLFPDEGAEEGSKKKKNQIKDNFDDDDDMEDDDAPKKSSKSKSTKTKSKGKSKWEDDDDDEPPFDTDDDDDTPRKSSKTKVKTKVKVKPSTSRVKVKVKPKSSSRRHAKVHVVAPKKVKVRRFVRSFNA